MAKHGKARTRLYFAYGANTNVEAMSRRCPRAVPVGPAKLHDYKLCFRGVADVIQAKGEKVYGALWKITEECEAALDRFEGYPRLYVKRIVNTREHAEVMLYVMRDRDWLSPPSPYYEGTLREGYADFDLPARQLDKAIVEAIAEEQEHLDDMGGTQLTLLGGWKQKRADVHGMPFSLVKGGKVGCHGK